MGQGVEVDELGPLQPQYPLLAAAEDEAMVVTAVVTAAVAPAAALAVLYTSDCVTAVTGGPVSDGEGALSTRSKLIPWAAGVGAAAASPARSATIAGTRSKE